MLWNELLRKGNVSLLQSQSDTQYCVCRNYNPNEKEDQQYDGGTYFCYWGVKTEKDYIPRVRLEELTTKFKDGLIEDDEESAMGYFEYECELTEEEKEWLGITESEED